MKLIIIVISLFCQKYLGFGEPVRRFNWFPWYLEKTAPLLDKTPIGRRCVGGLLIVFPLLLVAGVLALLLHGWAAGIFSLIVLFYCIGPGDVTRQVESYLKAKASEHKADAMQNLSLALGNTRYANERQNTLAVLNALFIRSFEQIFAVLFWFIVLGPFGAVLYRIFDLLYKESIADGSLYTDFADCTRQIKNGLEWIPARLLSLSYSLVGNFMKSFTLFIKEIFGGLDTNENLIKRCGLSTVELAVEDEQHAMGDEEISIVLALVNRALILWLVVVAVLTLVMWIK